MKALLIAVVTSLFALNCFATCPVAFKSVRGSSSSFEAYEFSKDEIKLLEQKLKSIQYRLVDANESETGFVIETSEGKIQGTEEIQSDFDGTIQTASHENAPLQAKLSLYLKRQLSTEESVQMGVVIRKTDRLWYPHWNSAPIIDKMVSLLPACTNH